MHIQYLKTIYSADFVNYTQIYFLMISYSGWVMMLEGKNPTSSEDFDKLLKEFFTDVSKEWASFIMLFKKKDINQDIEKSIFDLDGDYWRSVRKDYEKNNTKKSGVNALIKKTILDIFIK